MPKALRRTARRGRASNPDARGVIGTPGLKIEALRRFYGDGFLGIWLKAPILVPVAEYLTTPLCQRLFRPIIFVSFPVTLVYHRVQSKDV